MNKNASKMPIILYKKGGSLNEREGPLRVNVLPKIKCQKYENMKKFGKV